jgi:hypothetical protein
MIIKCHDCPVNCLGRSTHPHFCAWWATGDPTLRAHVRARSELGAIDRPPVVAVPAPAALPPPSFWRKAANRIGADARHVATGLHYVDELTLAERLARCHECPGHFWRASDGTCQHPTCGCAMAVKAARASASCPIGEW